MEQVKNGSTIRADYERAPLPLIVGITGHRDLRPEDIPALEALVRQSIEEISEMCPSTPLYILSPLAEGADRLVARVALSMGLKLVCPLPLPKDEYLKDFTTPDSVREFEELLAQAESVVEIAFMPGVTSNNIGQSAFRRKQYELVGAYLVRHCQVLIALWNGQRTLPGGTGQVVAFQETGVSEDYLQALSEVTVAMPFTYIDTPETGPVYHILTPRQSDPEVIGGEPLTLRTYFPQPGDGETIEETLESSNYDDILLEIDSYNRQAMALEQNPAKRAALQQSARYLFPDTNAQNLTAALQEVRRRYAIADVMAQRYQKGTFSTLAQLCLMAYFSAFSFEVCAEFAPKSGWLALLFPLGVAVTYFFFHQRLVVQKWQDHYQDYRALAEGLRVEFFWRLSGLPSGSAADHYLRAQRTELDWIRIAVRNLSLDFDSEDRLSSCEKTEDFDAVSQYWVSDQTKYYERAARRDAKELKRSERWVTGLVSPGPFIALVMALSLLIPGPVQRFFYDESAPGVSNPQPPPDAQGNQPTPPGQYTQKLIVLGIFAMAGVGGILQTYVEKRALPQQVKQYERMAILFHIADRHLRRFLREKDYERARKVIVELGQTSLGENGAWLLIHRERPVEMPHAG